MSFDLYRQIKIFKNLGAKIYSLKNHQKNFAERVVFRKAMDFI